MEGSMSNGQVEFSMAHNKESLCYYEDGNMEVIKSGLSLLGLKHLPDSENRIYFLDGVMQDKYRDIERFNPDCHNVAFINTDMECMLTKYIKEFNTVIVPSNKLKDKILSILGGGCSVNVIETMSSYASSYDYLKTPRRKNKKDNKPIDILFVGGIKPSPILDEVSILARRHNLKLAIYSDFFSYYGGNKIAKQFHKGNLPSFTELPKLVSQAKICITDTKQFEKRMEVIPLQYFDYINLGGFVVTQKNDFLESEFGMPTYSDKVELEDILLTHTKESKAYKQHLEAAKEKAGTKEGLIDKLKKVKLCIEGHSI